MGNKTPLYAQHLRLGAKIVDFAGWDMPLHYGSQVEEHHHVRRSAGVFDVSHMMVIDLHGERVRELVRVLLANDVGRLLIPGKAMYSCMLNEQGGIMDDLITYFLDPQWFRVVVNAATRDKDLAWIRRWAAGYHVNIRGRGDLAILAVQGPTAREVASGLLAPELRTAAAQLQGFQGAVAGDWLVARTGYTGEDGFEIILPGTDAPALWDALCSAGVQPCGLGARDTLRLEAGLNLYGADMDETTTPLESGLGWTVAWEPQERAFVGRTALEAQRAAGVSLKLVGLVLEDQGVLRQRQKVLVPGIGEGIVTSGGYSPTLGRSIALARVPAATVDQCQVEVRGRLLRARVVKPPFVRYGKSRLNI